ncbi:MAG: hypothetical protein L0Z50_18660 [Verrucomicrobiales bacterium]|nr:hypothetical protein [Verrucomicrobiales bacterium]
MTLDEFNQRIVQEEYHFLEWCLAEGVWDRVGKVSPKSALAFAEATILDLSDEATKERIRSDPTGAASFVSMVQQDIADRKTRMLLAARMPSKDLTLFYAMCSIVVDAAARDPDRFR